MQANFPEKSELNFVSSSAKKRRKKKNDMVHAPQKKLARQWNASVTDHPPGPDVDVSDTPRCMRRKVPSLVYPARALFSKSWNQGESQSFR